MQRKLVYYGDPVLRRHCEPVQTITDEIRQLCIDMIETMVANNGVGIAAPQVGVPLRIFISAMDGRDRDGYTVLSHPEIYINPKIISVSKKEILLSEGCISIPGVYEEIMRPQDVTIEALDINGNTFTIEATGWKARNLLHENDHINGVLHIDRVGKLRRKQLEAALKKIKKKYSDKK